MTTPERLAVALADRYRIERELGQGGMATVYLAHDLKHNRQVAIKVLRPELAAALGADRFLREIETTANLQHPHILPLFDSGQSDGFLYYVMPYVDGETLRARLARTGPLPLPEAIRYTGEIADALAKAHKAGVVHRDIKPENIFLADGHALVLDFGIAKALSEATGRDGLTTAGVSTRHASLHGAGTGRRRPEHRSSRRPLRPGARRIRNARRVGHPMRRPRRRS